MTLTTVCPGPVKTEFADAAGIGGARTRTPSFIWLTPEQVASAAVSGPRTVPASSCPASSTGDGIAGQHTPRAIALLAATRRFYPLGR